jgi:RHS repeat-associated protein
LARHAGFYTALAKTKDLGVNVNIFNRLLVKAIALLVSSSMVFSATAQTITYFHNDTLGSPRAATDATGNLLWKENYKPYGDTINNQAPAGSNKIGYAGVSYDSNVALSYMGDRYYDPILGRFTGIDPVGVRPGAIHSFSRYTYAANNPYKYLDRTGRSETHAIHISPPLPTSSLKGKAEAVTVWGAGGGVGNVGAMIVGSVTAAALIFNSKWGGTTDDKSSAQSGASSSAGAPPPDEEDDKAELESNEKHHPNSESPEPADTSKLYENSIADKSGVRWAKDSNGVIHRFSRPSNGKTHWNGSTGGKKPIQPQNVPVDIKRALGSK